MRWWFGLGVFALLIALQSALEAETQFDGTWEMKTTRLTKEPPIRISVSGAGQNIHGTIAFVYPNKSKRMLPMLSPNVTSHEITFRTDDRGVLFQWRLTLAEG